jgi:hypothetical protein
MAGAGTANGLMAGEQATKVSRRSSTELHGCNSRGRTRTCVLPLNRRSNSCLRHRPNIWTGETPVPTSLFSGRGTCEHGAGLRPWRIRTSEPRRAFTAEVAVVFHHRPCEVSAGGTERQRCRCQGEVTAVYATQRVSVMRKSV